MKSVRGARKNRWASTTSRLLTPHEASLNYGYLAERRVSVALTRMYTKAIDGMNSRLSAFF